tara:strand:- start:905 stop:1405 length:501 start_codon:yes stop_codon:yes gene_type:complete
MPIITSDGTISKPVFNYGFDTKKDTQSFGASSSFTTISGLSVTMALQNSSNYFLVLGQITIGCGSATSVIAVLQAGGSPIDALRHDAAGNRLRTTSRSSQDNQFEAHTIPLMGVYSPNTTSSQTFTIGGSANAGSFFVNTSATSNNDTSRDSARALTSLQVFELGH